MILKPLPLETMEHQKKAKRTVMALEMLQKKKERMRQSARRTKSAKTGNSVNETLVSYDLM